MSKSFSLSNRQDLHADSVHPDYVRGSRRESVERQIVLRAFCGICAMHAVAQRPPFLPL